MQTRHLFCLALIAGTLVVGCGKQQSITEQNVDPSAVTEGTAESEQAAAATPMPTVNDAAADEFATDVQPESMASELNEFAVDPPSESNHDSADHPQFDEVNLPKSVVKEPESENEVVLSEPLEMVDFATPAVFRMLLPTTAGPLIVDAEIRLGEADLSTAFQRRIDKVINDANDDPKTPLTWDELFSHVSGSPELFGRQQRAMNRGQQRQVIQQYDSNRNSRPDHEEVARFLFRNNGIDVPFRLMGTDYYREINRSESRLFAAIDIDDNGSLDSAEIDTASESLLRFDPNADQRIDVDEVITSRQANNNNDPVWNRRRSNRRGEVAMDLAGYVDWTMVSYALESMRGAAPFSLPQNRIDRIDVNENDSINSHEAKELKSGPPDLRLVIRFSPETETPTIDVDFLLCNPELVQVTNRAPSDVAISDDRFTLIASVVDRQATRNRIPREAFEILDANNDGGLDEDEIPDGASDEFSFADLDADKDGQLTYQEINRAEADREAPIWGVQVRARGAEFPDAVFAWLDANHDRFLATREILAAAARLRMCDTDDQAIRPTDIPDTFALQFVRADPMQDRQQNFNFPSSGPMVQTGQPRWTQNMDTNRDGEISRLEFPGSTEQFGKLDIDGNGFIDAVELDQL